jgi:hypothetical protein
MSGFNVPNLLRLGARIGTNQALPTSGLERPYRARILSGWSSAQLPIVAPKRIRGNEAIMP